MARSTIVGVFDSRTLAEQAIEKLTEAGFNNDQIWYSGHNAASGFFEGIKGLFKGEDATTGDLTQGLKHAGLSDDEVHYYTNEFKAGHAVVAVRVGERAAEAMSILRSTGAFDYDMKYGSARSREQA
jgi:hypothetical protein